MTLPLRPRPLRFGRTRRLLAAAGLCGLAGGCGQRGAAPVQDPAPVLETGAADATYLAPPAVLDVRGPIAGALLVEGRAPAGAQVRLTSPAGDQAQATADRAGAWRLSLPLGRAPRLFALSATAGGRVLHAEGALLLAPGALSPAVTLRAGAAALPLVVEGRRALDIAAVDYDPSGFVAAAGHAPAGASVALNLDGAAAAQGHADAQGRYALMAAGRRLQPGPHRLVVTAGGTSTASEVALTPPASLTTPYAAARTADGWRVEWALTGGGVQTTLVLAP